MLRFQKVNDIILIDAKWEPLPGFREGYRAGAFTIHKDQSMNNWVLSVAGMRLLGAWYIENAKKAANEFSTSRVNWLAPYKEIVKSVSRDSELLALMREIRDRYTGTRKTA
jgi:hypothetical protein